MFEWVSRALNIPPSVFRPFITATKEAFAFLESDYGFRLMVKRWAGAEAWVTYETQVTRITIHYELGAEPWIEIGRLEIRDGKVVQPASIGLDLLLRERGMPLNDEVLEPRDIGESEISRMIATRAERIRRLGSDLLRGDFRDFPKLQTKAEEELKLREETLFGPDA
jgi:hypothetical protein